MGIGESSSPSVFGIGFSHTSTPGKADVIVALKDLGGIDWNIQDGYFDDKGYYHMDKQDDIRHSSVTNRDGWTCLSFTRDFDSCDFHDVSIDTGTIYVLYFAKFVKEPQFLLRYGELKDLEYKLRPLQIRKSPYVPPSPPEGTLVFDVHVNSVLIPNVETTYWCKTMKLPVMRDKMHIIGFEGRITPSSVGVVHHLEVFHCIKPPSAKVRNYDAPCNSETKPMGLTACRKVIGAWAMGAKGLFYPPEAGFPIGGEDFVPYIVIEIHYNNPDLKEGLIDNSGLRFYFSRELRRHDIGIMELGLNYDPRNSIPPFQTSFQLPGFCTAKCTEKAFSPEGIRVFGSQLHTHSTGKKVVTYHLTRDGQVHYLNADFHYSPHYQEIRYLQKIVNVLPGDALINVCTYDTQDKSSTTLGGISIQNEMCLNYIYYYPASSLELCKSIASIDTMRNFFQHEYLKEDVDLSNAMGTGDLEELFNSVKWDEEAVTRLQQIYWHELIDVACNSSAGHNLPGNWANQLPPKLPIYAEQNSHIPDCDERASVEKILSKIPLPD